MPCDIMEPKEHIFARYIGIGGLRPEINQWCGSIAALLDLRLCFQASKVERQLKEARGSRSANREVS